MYRYWLHHGVNLGSWQIRTFNESIPAVRFLGYRFATIPTGAHQFSFWWTLVQWSRVERAFTGQLQEG